MPTLDDAVALHRAGRTDEAARSYAALLAADPRDSAARHNLGMIRLGQGNPADGLPLLDRAWLEDGANEGWQQSLPGIVRSLVQLGCWEEALPWLDRAAARGADDTELQALRERITRPPWISPEVYDPLQGRSLLRHAPREAASYVYAIDVVGTCNLRCPTCPVGNFAAAERPKGFMPVTLFERILDKIVAECVAPRPQVWLFNWGEPLLHPELPALVAAVKQRGLPCHLSTNLNVHRGLRELARANPDEIKISLSGFTPERYARTHARGHLRLVKANMHMLRHWLDEEGATTRVWVGHHLYRDSEHEVPAVKALCDELGYEHAPIAAFYQPLERLVELLEGGTAARSPDPVLAELIEPPQVYLPRIQRTRSSAHDCELRFNQTVINHDGSVALCCSVYDKPNMLGLDFLATPHAELEAARYRHPFCGTCMKHGLSYTVRDARRLHNPRGDAPAAA
uniref:Radical SAM domain protein n=1 Tax=uncultured microorganism TaxID=358574 RepID=F8UHZ5_9ZZZZ|nr:radical SAM domain protein [uncultured microorganism]